jgi:hypothetical protein
MRIYILRCWEVFDPLFLREGRMSRDSYLDAHARAQPGVRQTDGGTVGDNDCVLSDTREHGILDKMWD